MRGKAAGVNAIQRQLMHYLRDGDWVLVSKLSHLAGQRAIDRMAENDWIERQGSGPRLEIKLTPAGWEALKMPVRLA